MMNKIISISKKARKKLRLARYATLAVEMTQQIEDGNSGNDDKRMLPPSQKKMSF
jgi:hypothetical protein